MKSLGAAAGITLLFLATVHAATYTITDLGTLGGSQSDAFGLNASSRVVGRATTTGNVAFDPVLFGSSNTDLGTFGGAINQANAINDAGAIVGSNALPGNTTAHAFVAFGHTLVDLGTLGGASSYAHGINAAGQITGYAQTGTATHAFRYQNGKMNDLGALFGTGSSFGYGINAAGYVVGESISGSIHAFLENTVTMSDLGFLGTGNTAIAYAINDNNQIVGSSNLVTNGVTIHAFLYQNGGMSDLGALSSGDNATAYAINNSSQIVGSSNLIASGTTYHAFLSQGGQMTDLNDLIPANSGWVLNSARAINAAGQIAGSGTLNGQTHAFLLTPVASPMPSSEPPRIYINGARRVTTTRSSVRVEGSVGGTVSVVKYRIGGKGSYRAARGVTGWRFRAKLQPGRNIVQVIAVGPTGNASRPGKVVIIRQ